MKLKHNKKFLLFTTSFLASLCVCLLVTALYVRNKSEMEYAQMEQVVLVNANKTNNVITNLLYKTQVLAALVVQDDGGMERFDEVAATIMDDPAIKNVLIAPNGIVSNVYPFEGNEAVIGLNFFEPGKGNKEAMDALAAEQLVLGGPFDLVQGGQALVGRLPVFTKDAEGKKNFWGLVSVTLNYPKALDGAELDQLQNQGFAFEIWRDSPDSGERQLIAASDYSYAANGRYVEKDFSILNAKWQFRISPVKLWYQYPETWILSFGSLSIALLVAFFIINTYNLKLMKNEFELLTYTDPLTGILNRRGMFSALNELISREDCVLTLCYMDLNEFKHINDRYGHGIGDKVLQCFSEVFLKYCNKNHLFARIGGDEFILVFKGVDDKSEICTFFDKIRQELKDVFIDDCMREQPIRFSLGTASYPAQCQNVDDLISRADGDMYENKIMQKKMMDS